MPARAEHRKRGTAALLLAGVLGAPQLSVARELASSARDQKGSDPSALLALRRRHAAGGVEGGVYAGVGAGRGLRLNNPFRLHTVLGTSSRGPSLTATYLDLFLGGDLVGPRALRHGPVVHHASALEGISQQVLTPGYRVAWVPRRRLRAFLRLGVPLVLTPDSSAGWEVGLGASVFLTGAIALQLEGVGSAYYGAATPETGVSVVPVAALQLGVLVDYEVLP